MCSVCLFLIYSTCRALSAVFIFFCYQSPRGQDVQSGETSSYVSYQVSGGLTLSMKQLDMVTTLCIYLSYLLLHPGFTNADGNGNFSGTRSLGEQLSNVYTPGNSFREASITEKL